MYEQFIRIGAHVLFDFNKQLALPFFSMDPCQVIGSNVRRYRLAKGMSQVQLAALSGVQS
jgi:hypothetical protein